MFASRTATYLRIDAPNQSSSQGCLGRLTPSAYRRQSAELIGRRPVERRFQSVGELLGNSISPGHPRTRSGRESFASGHVRGSIIASARYDGSHECLRHHPQSLCRTAGPDLAGDRHGLSVPLPRGGALRESFGNSVLVRLVSGGPPRLAYRDRSHD